MIREMDFKRDMDGVAALIDVAFGDEFKEEGRQAKQELMYTKKLYPLLWITRHVFAPFSDRFKFIFHGYVWEEEGRIVGSVNVNKSGNDITRWYISGVAVAPEFRRGGIARALVQNAIDFAGKNGAQVITLDVRRDNPPAFRLYESLGFFYIDTSFEMKCDKIAEMEDLHVFQKRMAEDWRAVYELSKKCVPESVQTVLPLREKDFRPSLPESILLKIVDILTWQKRYHYKAIREGRVVATLSLTAKKRNSPHSLTLMAESEYQSELTEAALRKAFFILGGYPRHNVLTFVNECNKGTLDVLNRHNFTRIQTSRGMALDMREMLLLVDENDKVVGKETKERCHDGGGLLHRAFMVIVVKGGKILLTQRSERKRLWPGLWDGSVSSHVHEGERYEESAQKRLREELHIECTDIRYLFKFYYQVPYEGVGAEHEICAVLVARYDGDIQPDRDEISSFKFMEPEDFIEDMERDGLDYCPWLKIAFAKMKKEYWSDFKKIVG